MVFVFGGVHIANKTSSAALWRVAHGLWTHVSTCPGTPRRSPAFACTKTSLYILGGATASGGGVTDASVVDNWRYNIADATWKRLRDSPTAATAVRQAATFDGRFVLMVAPAFRPPLTLAEDGSLVTSGAPIVQQILGKASVVTNCSTSNVCGVISYRTDDSWHGNPAGCARGDAAQRVCGAPAQFNDVFVYDVRDDFWGFADSLPYNVRAPAVAQELLAAKSLFAVADRSRVLRADITGLKDWWLTNRSTDGVAMPDLVARDVRDYRIAPVLQASAAGTLAPSPASPLPQFVLRKMLDIEYSLTPDMPHGLEIPFVGVANGSLVVSSGFCGTSLSWVVALCSVAIPIATCSPTRLGAGGSGIARKGEVYRRGFFNTSFARSLAPPASTWGPVPPFPGTGRQNGMSVTIDGAMYSWGGFAYPSSNPLGRHIFDEGYRLDRSTRDGRWRWTALPSLPFPVADAGMCAIGSTVYLHGGADFSAQEVFCYDSQCNGSAHGLGRMLHSLDTAKLSEGATWQALPSCPGTPRAWHQANCIGGKVFVMGGSSAQMKNATGFTIAQPTIANVVDNWQYNVATRDWTRLRDLPTSGTVFGGAGGGSVFKDEKIVLINAYQYDRIRTSIVVSGANETGDENEHILPPYGVVTHAPSTAAPLFGWHNGRQKDP